jgi:hypothetical protein
MATVDVKLVLKQIDDALAKYLKAKETDPHLEEWNKEQKAETITRVLAAIERFAPPGSAYRKQAEAVIKQNGADTLFSTLALAGILSAMRADYDAGYLRAIHELIHAEVFSDFLEMAEHLLAEGYKDAAAVIAGSVLEEHLRKLSSNAGIAVNQVGGSPKKASLLNDELRTATVYGLLDHKGVTAWLDLRNNAAHGKYGQYQKEQVALMVQSVRDFITRHPA